LLHRLGQRGFDFGARDPGSGHHGAKTECFFVKQIVAVTDEEVAEELEALFEGELESSAVRIGLLPKRAIPFRADQPFEKIAAEFTSPKGKAQRVEVAEIMRSHGWQEVGNRNNKNTNTAGAANHGTASRRRGLGLLASGQQIVVNGIHPQTQKPYRWHGGEPGPKLRREDLPLITADAAAAFIGRAGQCLSDPGARLPSDQ
jgi:hypothetical protein